MYKNLAKTFFIGKNLVYLPSCHSTNDIASGLIKNDQFFDGTVVITNNQTAGKGQRGNTWESNSGDNLMCSLVVRPRIKVQELFSLNMRITLAIALALEDLLPDKRVEIKWPNDILIHRKKVGGILIENSIKGDEID